MADKQTVTLAFRVDPEKAAVLDRLAETTDRPKSWLLEQALDNYLVNQSWQIDMIKEGIAAADAGKTIPHAKIRDWLLTWGKENEGEPPISA